MELVATSTGTRIITRPAAYDGPRKTGLGPRQLAWIAARGWTLGPRFVKEVK